MFYSCMWIEICWCFTFVSNRLIYDKKLTFLVEISHFLCFLSEYSFFLQEQISIYLFIKTYFVVNEGSIQFLMIVMCFRYYRMKQKETVCCRLAFLEMNWLWLRIFVFLWPLCNSIKEGMWSYFAQNIYKTNFSILAEVI